MNDNTIINFSINQNIKIRDVFELTPSISNDNRGNIWTSFLAIKRDAVTAFFNLLFKRLRYRCNDHLKGHELLKSSLPFPI